MPYTHKLEFMPARAVNTEGAMDMKRKRITRVLFRLYRSMTLKVKADDNWTVAEADDYSLGNTWVTQDVELPFPGKADRDAAVRVVGTDALPLTILAAAMEVSVSD